MPTVTGNLVDGHEYQDTFAGFEITQTFFVYDLVQPPERQLIEATQQPGVPQLGDVYPGTTGINCVQRTSSPFGENKAKVVCRFSAQKNNSTYNQPEPTGGDVGLDVKQITSGTREITTTEDRGGNPMLLTVPASVASLKPYLSEARILIPVGTIVFQRPESSVAVAAARDLVGRINNAPINNYGVNTLLFDSLDSESTDGGYTWDCVYTFRYDSRGWKHFDRFRAPDGRVPADAVEEPFDVLDEVSFATLNLDFSASQTPIT
jgi:hypothetical protein